MDSSEEMDEEEPDKEKENDDSEMRDIGKD
jgi:hypothetical protein